MNYMDIFMKKTMISGAIISVVMMSMGTAMAANMSPELKVKGQMAIPSCQVSIANDGVYDLGKIANSLISPNKDTSLKTISNNLNVICEADTFLSFTVVDNRASTSSSTASTSFGLGNVNGDGKLGYYQMKLKGAAVDSTTTSLYSANKGSSSFSATSETYIDKNKVTGWAKSGNVQASGKHFMALMSMEPVLASSSVMGGPISDNVKLDGSATLNFSYGL